MRISHLFFAATLSVSPLAFAGEAHAFDSANFVKQLETLIEAEGAEVTYGAVATEGEALTINNLVIEDEKTGNKSEISKLTFMNAAQNENGGFSYDSMEADAVVLSGKNGSKTEIEKVTSLGLEFAKSPDSDPLPEKADSMLLSNITISSTKRPDQGSLNIPSVSAQGFVRTSTRNFTLQGAKIDPFQGRMFDDKGKPIDVSFSGASMSDFEYFGLFGIEVGNFNLGSFSVNTVTEEGPMNVSIDGIELENYYAWDPSEPSRPLIPENDIKYKIKPVNVSFGGNTVFSMDESTGVAINDADALTTKSTAELRNLTIDFSAFPKNAKTDQSLKPLKDLGYEQITMNLSAAADADLKSGIIDIKEMNFDFLDAGSFNMKLNVSGYTEQVAKSIASTAASLQNNDNPQAQQAQMLQLMAMFAPLSLQQMELKVTDASLLGKVLDLQARQNNRSAEELTAIVPPMAGIMLAPFQVPELASAISTALGTFMQGNKSIKASIEPVGGIAITEMIALGSGAQAGSIPPADIVNRLNLKVEAE